MAFSCIILFIVIALSSTKTAIEIILLLPLRAEKINKLFRILGGPILFSQIFEKTNKLEFIMAYLFLILS